ncbi:lamina-associated polypeptide 2, isoforms alpha/zeta-like [Notechis scutatus]|uniref:Lamina-associated polypeptide 2, isoforms alpha/zeta-like n=1 Tax=Notechis scutatus TaxID=8663 RepID=A0A6J1W064_9SAUR|nr:lamina-associated polypeptide 2, isoforms alpha/zeta-like [Notechis scutatus]XP_026548662.1 lamina-associated polypeptide 2, isoforms alpha/zeta-like [Notechis scutatus]
MADPGTAGPRGEADQSSPKVSAGPKLAAKTAAARPKATALPCQGASKAADKRAAEAEAAPKGGRRPPAEETVGVSRAFPAQQPSQPIGAKHQSPLGSQAGSPGGAREQLSLPSDQAFMAPDSKPPPGEGQPPPKRRKGAPEASFTPTAVAGLGPQESQGPEISDQMKILISEAIAQGIAAGLQQKPQAAPGPPENPQHEEQHRGSTRRLFYPALFKSLLLKAKATTGMGAEPALEPVDPNELLFSQPTIESEEIPSPELFQRVIQKIWAQPGPCPPLSEDEKMLYNMAPDFSHALEPPTIDGPVAALVSSTIVACCEDALSPEERKVEQTLCNVHKTAAMAIKTSTAASFFNRASLMWLRQMQARIPSGDLRFHQDIDNVIAATEFSADATLRAAKFASKALASSVVARRQLWLRHWEVSANHKSKLASAPYKGGMLFGEALDSLLVKTRRGRKVLPSQRRPAARRGKNFRGASFQPTDRGFNAPQPQKAYTHRPDWQPDRSEFKDKNRGYFQGKRPFRGSGHRPFRRSK